MSNSRATIPQTGTKEERATPAIWLAGFTLGAIGLVGYLMWATSGNLVREGNWIGVDFHVYYQAARVFTRGQDIYTAGISPPYVYPPLLAALVTPLAALPVNEATIIWKLLQHVCLLVASGVLISMAPARVRPLAAGVLLLGLLTVPLRDEIQVGESNSLVLALVVGAVWLVNRGRGSGIGGRYSFYATGAELDLGALTEGPAIGAGALLALAVSIKVLPVLLVAYFWWRGPRSVAAWATGFSLALQALMFALTPSTSDYWFVQFPGLFGQAFPFLDNQSLNAFISRATLPAGDAEVPNMQLFDGDAIRPALTWLANLLVLAGAVWVLWRSGPRHKATPPLLIEVGLVLMTIHLVSGSTWLHHLVDLAIPLTAAFCVWQAGKVPLSAVAVAGATFLVLLPHPADMVLWADTIAPNATILAWLAGSLPLFAVSAWWVWLAFQLRKQPEPL